MENWTPDRIHRFKNILAFLVTTFKDYKFVDVLMAHAPVEIEENYMKYLGPNLPTPFEYAQGLTPVEESFFDRYCAKYNPSETA